ncbi:MAG: ribonuclease Z [Thermodesulforhabdaceae bacterium]
MKITFLGVGEACDEKHPNTSILLEIKNAKSETITVLMDCGFSVPFQFWKYISDPEKLDAVWISHFHGDHFFGTPLLLLRLWEMKRQKPLTIIGQKGIESVIDKALDLAYPGFRSRFAFELFFEEIKEGEAYHFFNLNWISAPTEHSQKNLSVAIETPEGKVFYSGDGKPTKETEEIAKETLLIIHEAFHIEPSVPGHGTVRGVLDMAERARAHSVACVHVQRDVRRNYETQIRQMLLERKSLIQAFLPETGEIIEIGKK